MQDYHIKNENLSRERRVAIIRETFCAKMAVIYSPHAHLRGNEQGVALYLGEVIDLLNDKLPWVRDRDSFIDLLRKTWKQCVNKHDSRYFFSLAEINKAAADVAKEYNRLHVDPIAVKYQTKAEQEPARGSKDDPANQGWTIAKCKEAIADMERMVANGEINRALGNSLVRIPMIALRRLQEKEAGHAPDFDTI